MTETIPQFIPTWDKLERNAVLNVLDSDYILEHKETRKFEKRFAEYVGARFCVTCTSGTIALYMAMKVFEPEDRSALRVIVPSYQGIFAANAGIMAGCGPWIYDVSENGSITESIHSYGIVVHANGRLGNPTSTEDCAQAVNHHTKNMISCYSFASSKHLTMGGQGGAICCDTKRIFDLLTEVKDHGRTDRQNLKSPADVFTKWGTNFKVTEMQSAFGLIQLRKLPGRLKRLKEIWNIYKDIIGVGYFLEEMPKWYIDIFVKDPDKIINELATHNIILKRINKPLHLQPRWNKYTNFPNANNLYDHGVFLPSTTNLSNQTIQHIAEIIKLENDRNNK